jgi:nitrite reductase/ring-hydroxylating ferredoxin subunit
LRLCREDEIAEGEGRGFLLGSGGQQRRVFVVRFAGALHAYLNSCPHIGTPLDWVKDKFFASDDRHLICATHGALFRPEDGVCVAGPCEGEALAPLPIAVEDGWIVSREPPPVQIADSARTD